MISGALLLNKEETFWVYIKKRVLPTGIMIFFFSAFQYVYTANAQDELSIIDFLKNIYKSPIHFSYWYLYIFFTYILYLPFLRSTAKNLTEDMYLYLFVLKIIFSILLPIVEFDFASRINLAVRILESNIFYPLMGYYLSHVIETKDITKKKITIMWIGSIFAIILTEAMMKAERIKIGEYTEKYMEMCTFIIAITFFATILKYCSEIELHNRTQIIISKLGQSTLGIYLLGNVAKDITEPVFNMLVKYVNSCVANAIHLLLQFIVGAIIWMSLMQMKKCIHLFKFTKLHD